MARTKQRSFITGDRWLYYKIYTGISTSDQLLLEIVQPLVSKFIEEKIITQWFFIRYADPKHHLRLRFHLQDPKQIGRVLSTFQPYFAQFMDQDLIWKVQTDTYHREMERYGSNAIHLAEEIFFHESEMILNYLSFKEQIVDPNLQWLFCLKAMDDFLASFQLDLKQKTDLMEQLKDGFAREFNMNKALKKQINQRYSTHRKTIEEFLNLPLTGPSEYQPIFDLIIKRRDESNKTIQEILEKFNDDEIGLLLPDLISSYIHMLINRLFSDRNRVHELLYYDFLYRYYRACIARKK